MKRKVHAWKMTAITSKEVLKVYVMSVYAPTKASAASDTYTRLAFRRNVPLTRTESAGRTGGAGQRVSKGE